MTGKKGGKIRKSACLWLKTEAGEPELQQTIDGEKAVNDGAQMVGTSRANDAARRRRCQLAHRCRPIRRESLKELLGYRT